MSKDVESVSDGQRAVASPSVPLDCNISHEFYAGTGMGGHLANRRSNRPEYKIGKKVFSCQ